MNPSIENSPTHPTSVKSMLILLVLAFLGSLLNTAGIWVLILLQLGYGARLADPARLSSLPVKDALIVFLFAAVAFVLLLAGFLGLSLYPERGRRQWAGGLLAVVLWSIGVASVYSLAARWPDLIHGGIFSLLLQIGVGISVGFSILASERIKDGRDLLGLGVGLVIGTCLLDT